VYERVAVAFQYLLPKRALTVGAGKLAGWRGGVFTRALIAAFVRRYRVDLGEAVAPDVGHYATFNDFFTRALQAGARPLAPDGLLCPVDGAVSQFGRIEEGRIFQAKEHRYCVFALLGGDDELAARFERGSFATLYLSPRDYHRIHMPARGRLVKMIHVPGSLFSVNPMTARNIPGLFARNERVVCVFEREDGPFALVLVGATIVGSVATAWHGVVSPPRRGEIRTWDYDGQSIELDRGEEMGRFLLGSTVILLFPCPGVSFAADWAPARAVRMGEAMGGFNTGGSV
jgi:phosphatidylserine decarboxylase